MSLDQYNSLMSRMLNQWHALAKLRAEIKDREGRVYQEYRKSGHLVCNCRNRKEKIKGKLISQNKFEMIASRVMQCRVKEEVKVRRQEIVKERVQCFRCWRIGHYKLKCPNIEVEKKKRREKEVVHVARPQKVQQKRRPVHSTQKKVQEYCKKWNMPLESALLLERGWITREMWQCMWTVESTKVRESRPTKIKDKDFVIRVPRKKRSPMHLNT